VSPPAKPRAYLTELICFSDEIFGSDGSTIFSANSILGNLELVVDITGSNGVLHTHLSFFLENQKGEIGGPVGAYRIELKLFESKSNNDTSVAIAASPIALVFNRGLAQDKFELAVSAAADLRDNSVFVAETGMLTIQRVKALGSYYQAKLKHLGDNKFEPVDVQEIPATKE
jgi:hypothetical protein